VDAWDKLKYRIPESTRKKKSYKDVMTINQYIKKRRMK
jgi:hypothetical protein